MRFWEAARFLIMYLPSRQSLRRLALSTKYGGFNAAPSPSHSFQISSNLNGIFEE